MHVMCEVKSTTHRIFIGMFKAPYTEQHTNPHSWQLSYCACVEQEMTLLKLVTM